MENLILVVDDEKPIVEILKVNLIKSGYRVIEAYDGNEAVVKAISEEPDLILLDVMLPGMDGFSVCKKIRETSSVPIIMLTAREEEVDKMKFIYDGIGLRKLPEGQRLALPKQIDKGFLQQSLDFVKINLR